MSTSSANQNALRALILTSIFSALIIVMTVVPYTGYIAYGVIEITTLHIVTILGAVCLGLDPLGLGYGAVIGGVWGLTSLLRAYMAFPIYLNYGFGNFFVAVLPRILVGLVAGVLFALLRKTKLNDLVAAAVCAAAGTLTNTVLVLSAMNLWLKFNGQDYSSFYETFKTILTTVIAVNGLIELAAAVIIVPAVYKAVSKSLNKMNF